MQKIKAGIINFWNDEEGMGTLEILLIVVVLVAVALLFSDQLTSWVEKLLENIDTKIPGE
ncbi:Flp1 family type IVb pilin [Paraliobacillus sediminis]|uniref:Flp1 family type IVb pilin n=1 Tax=Paraliobacillus sediminis TaxID=1885916 RepID=UPI000E3CB00B|nr:Flp1 family type IVb pilin [Paraliobacillus sediminis]